MKLTDHERKIAQAIHDHVTFKRRHDPVPGLYLVGADVAAKVIARMRRPARRPRPPRTVKRRRGRVVTA